MYRPSLPFLPMTVALRTYGHRPKAKSFCNLNRDMKLAFQAWQYHRWLRVARTYSRPHDWLDGSDNLGCCVQRECSFPNASARPHQIVGTSSEVHAPGWLSIV